MTLPDERYRAMKRVRPFMYLLLDTPLRKLRKDELRLAVRYLLKHYPTNSELERLAELAPDLLEARRED